MKTVIYGGRDFKEYPILEAAIELASDYGIKVTSVISGKAQGAGALGEQYAKKNGLGLELYPADWNKHGKKAGFMRNSTMVEVCEAGIGLWDAASNGTLDTTIKLYEVGKPFFVYVVLDNGDVRVVTREELDKLTADCGKLTNSGIKEAVKKGVIGMVKTFKPQDNSNIEEGYDIVRDALTKLIEGADTSTSIGRGISASATTALNAIAKQERDIAEYTKEHMPESKTSSLMCPVEYGSFFENRADGWHNGAVSIARTKPTAYKDIKDVKVKVNGEITLLLAPSSKLLYDHNNKKIDWPEYTRRYWNEFDARVRECKPLSEVFTNAYGDYHKAGREVTECKRYARYKTIVFALNQVHKALGRPEKLTLLCWENSLECGEMNPIHPCHRYLIEELLDTKF